MLHPLQEWIGTLRRKVRGLAMLYGGAWVVAILLALYLAVALADYLIRFEDRGLRVLVWALSLGAVAAAVWWFVARALRARLTDLDLARRLERRFPQLRDRLASTLQFLSEPEDSPLAGSADLRRAVVNQVAAEVEPLRGTDVLETKPVWIAASVAAVLVAVVAILALVRPELASIAAMRQINPWSDTAWPQQHHLVLRAPQRVARGADLTVEIADRDGGPLPEQVLMHLEFDGQGAQVVEVRPQNEVHPFQLPAINESVTLWVEGGDDRSMRREPVRIEVVDTPELAQLQVKLHPPEYTAWPAATADRHFRALEGTRIEFHGRATLPLEAVYFEYLDESLPGTVAADGQSFSFALPAGAPLAELAAGGGAAPGFLAGQPHVSGNGSYRFRLVGKHGFAGQRGESYDITSLPDKPPQVVLEEPQADGLHTLYVAPDAVLPIVARVTEDRTAVTRVWLRYRRSDRSEQGTFEQLLYQRTEGPPQRPEGLASPELGEVLPITAEWSLAPLNLPPRTQLEVTLAATDFAGREGTSTPPLRLTVATRGELQDRLAQRQGELLSHLAELLAVQRQARTQLGATEQELKDLEALRQAGFDQLKGAAASQEQVRRGLADPQEGLPAEIARLLAAMEMNQLDASDTRRQLEELAAELKRLDEQHLTPLAQQLPQAVRSVQQAFESSTDDAVPVEKQVAQQVTAAGKHQDAVIQGLERLQAEMTQWDNYRRFARELSVLRREHEAIAQETARLGRETVTRRFDDLTPQQQTDLRQLARREDELARRLDVIQQNMERMSRELEEFDPMAAGVLTDALHHARQQGLSNRLREASRKVQQNQVGQAIGEQNAVAGNLDEMLDILVGRREHELSRLVDKLREAQNELGKLQERQQALQQQAQQAASQTDSAEQRRRLQRLQREQAQVREETERLARRLQRLQAEQASQAMQQAGQNMQGAEQAAGQDQAKQAGQEAQQALEDLQDAQRELANRLRQAQRDLAQEQLAKIEDRLKSLRDRQQTVVDEVLRLRTLATERGLGEAERATARDLARSQDLLAEETLDLRATIAQAEVFAATLQLVVRDMEAAANQLRQADASAELVRISQAAHRRLDQLVRSLEAVQARPPAEGDQQSPQQQEQPSQAPTDGIPALAQLRMLKMMQEDLKARTAALDAELAGRPPSTDAQRRQLAELAEEQGRLAELMLNLSQPSELKPPQQPDPEDETRLRRQHDKHHELVRR